MNRISTFYILESGSYSLFQALYKLILDRKRGKQGDELNREWLFLAQKTIHLNGYSILIFYGLYVTVMTIGVGQSSYGLIPLGLFMAILTYYFQQLVLVFFEVTKKSIYEYSREIALTKFQLTSFLKKHECL